jgi:ribosomal protein S18 acetylase RimI-like enzyme
MEILSDLSTLSLTSAVKANLYAFFGKIGVSSAAVVQHHSHGFRWHTQISHPWFNGMLSMRFPAGKADQIIHETVNFFQANHVSSFTWWPALQLETDAWKQHLLAHGFQYDKDTPGMAIDLAALPHPEQPPLTIQPVADVHTFRLWIDTFVRGYGIPSEMGLGILDLFGSLGVSLPLRHYIGYLHDRPVAASTLFLAAGVAGIYNVATVPEARGKGFGSAMTLAPLYEARAIGYRAGVLQSSEMGYSVYQRLGFQKLCQMDHFSWQAPSA